METQMGSFNFPMEPQSISCIFKNTNQASQSPLGVFFVFLTTLKIMAEL